MRIAALSEGPVALIPLFARLGDIFGRRRLLLGALGAFCVGSLMCAVADSIGLLIAGSIVQGAGAAIGPLAVGIARDALPPERLTLAFGTFVGAAGAGAAIGYVLSGLLVDHVSVAAIFWFLFGLSIALLAAAIALVPTATRRRQIPVDFAGATLLAAGLAALLLASRRGTSGTGRRLGPSGRSPARPRCSPRSWSSSDPCRTRS